VGLGNLVRRGQLKIAQKIQEEKGLKMPRDLWLQPRIMEAIVQTREVHVDADMWLSPSILAGWCPRAWVIAQRVGVPLLDEIGPDNRWWMDGGTAHHTLFQEMWMGPARIIKGGWECPSCLHVEGYDPDDKTEILSHGESYTDKVTPRSSVLCPKVCPACGHKPTWRSAFRYIEPLVYDLELKVAGLSDGVIDWGPYGGELWDLKTKSSTDGMGWIKEAPDEGNVKQLNWYLGLAGMKYGRLVYVDRTSKHLADAFVEHQIVFDPEMMLKEKEKVSVFREAAKNPESSIPACPDGGRTRFGACQCRELEDSWKSFRTRP